MRPPTTILGSNLNEALPDPQIIDQSGRFAAGDRTLDLIQRVFFGLQLVLELTTEVIAARQ